MQLKLNELSFHNLVDWPFRFKAILLALLLLILLVLGYFFIIKATFIKVDSITAQQSVLKANLTSKQQKAAKLSLYKKQVQALEQLFYQLKKQLPNKKEIPSLLESISYTGLAAGLEFRLIKPRLAQQTIYYQILPIDISVDGSYHQLAAFISGVAALSRIVMLNDFSIRSIPKTDKLRLSLAAATYRYQPKPISSTGKIPKPLTRLQKAKIDQAKLPNLQIYQPYLYKSFKSVSPFVEPKYIQVGKNLDPSLKPDLKHKSEPLEEFPLSGLKYVGMIQQKHKVWGLVKAPNNMVYRVKLGSYLGQSYGQVQQITSEHLYITELVARGQGFWDKRKVKLSVTAGGG